MEIEVRCFATLARFTPGDGFFELPDGATAAEAIAALGIPADDVNIIFINGKAAELASPLAEGDRLGLFPAVGGG
ncbi:thiamine S protein [Desulfovibrio sp. X2]|uniref:MoaD/ThiS family protein n=1 Tax=Desulfovibrio sp. X2 TaxID=941449 RepID=UPI000358C421|nr:MoaD/ThiS family protein [Desulfovibrio sp. X2]EPR43584.1 thiamine S protein [Desulfovibrio sp. X2]